MVGGWMAGIEVIALLVLLGIIWLMWKFL